MAQIRFLLLVAWLMIASAAWSQTLPALTGRVIDGANLLSPQQESALTAKLAAIEQASTRQLVVTTVPDLGGRDIAEYGIRLAEAWKIGQKDADNGAILIVAPAERRVRIEVGYGLEGILTDAVSSLIIQNRITPAFRAGDYPGGIEAGVDAIGQVLQAPPEDAERTAIEAARTRQAQVGRRQSGGSIMPLLFWGAVFMFVVLPMLRGMGGGGRGGRRYRRGGGMDPATSILLWEVANAAMRSGRGGGGFGGGGFGGGGFGGGGGGGGGFSGGGGSFGGGGASGGW